MGSSSDSTPFRPTPSTNVTLEADSSVEPSPTSVDSFPLSSSLTYGIMTPEKNVTVLNSKEADLPAREEEYFPLAVRECRDIILDLSEPVAGLCKAVRANSDPLLPLAKLFSGLLRLAHVSGLNLRDSIFHKLRLNRQKYPVDLCKGKAGKYTEYSSTTGITRLEGQSLVSAFDQSFAAAAGDTAVTVRQSKPPLIGEWWYPTVAMVAEFRDERNWNQYHTPRNLCLAITGELGELAEILQFDGDEVTEIKMKNYDNLMKEMADVAIYSLSLAEASPPASNGTPFITRLLEQIEELIEAQHLE